MSFPTGTFLSSKMPREFVSAATTGSPGGMPPQRSQVSVALAGGSAVFGTYTSTLWRGRGPLGAKTVPVSVVVAPPGHVVCLHCRFLQPPGPGGDVASPVPMIEPASGRGPGSMRDASAGETCGSPRTRDDSLLHAPA